nr:Na(+)-translocating NADH-quinone reductase subunit C [Methylomarinum sp. Ch1-1]MDP4522316.1 Na(+)-translocating NADH-quinone reductase subunit C [Methylomarinum sp. Ch1-1]
MPGLFFFVSTAAVWLNSIQQQNRRLDRIGNILSVAGLAGHRKNIEQIYRDRIVPVMIDLASGERVEPRRFDDVLNIENFDIETLASDSDYGVAIPPEQDIAKIKRRPRYMVVYLVKKDNRFDQVILPVYGKGLWSTMYGFLALNNDLNTIAGITFYQHGETPGLGGEIENPKWQQSWRGKRAFNSAGEVIIEVVRGEVEANSPDAKHQIDSLSGATLTSRGVDNLIHYWLGEHGYGPLLDRLRQGSLADLTAAGKQE